MDSVKLPSHPEYERLREIDPDIRLMPPSNWFRVYFAGGRFPTLWNKFRYFGPVDARFDHHETTNEGRPFLQNRGILYCSNTVSTCVAEVFQNTRLIDPITDSPYLVSFKTLRTMCVLDLTRTFPLKAGASQVINSGSRDSCKNWSRGFYEAYETVEGLYYRSSLTGDIALALYERAIAEPLFAKMPIFHRQLNDLLLRVPLREVCEDIGYDALW